MKKSDADYIRRQLADIVELMRITGDSLGGGDGSTFEEMAGGVESVERAFTKWMAWRYPAPAEREIPAAVS